MLKKNILLKKIFYGLLVVLILGQAKKHVFAAVILIIIISVVACCTHRQRKRKLIFFLILAGGFAGGYFLCENKEFITKMDKLVLYPVETTKKYSDYYEQPFDSNKCYTSPGFSEEELFGKNCNAVVYGKVIDCVNYIFKKENYYSCHLIKIQVKKSIFGEAKKGEKIYLFCRWKYEGKSYKKGDLGIFICEKPTLTLELQEIGEEITAIGSMHRTRLFHYALTNEWEGLDRLNNKEEVLDYWKKNGWIMEE